MIISNWMIYLIMLSEDLIKLSVVSIFIVIAYIGSQMESVFINKDADERNSKRIRKICIIVFAIALFISLCPRKDTLYLMVLNDYITVDNLMISKEILLTTIKEIKSALK